MTYLIAIIIMIWCAFAICAGFGESMRKYRRRRLDLAKWRMSQHRATSEDWKLITEEDNEG